MNNYDTIYELLKILPVPALMKWCRMNSVVRNLCKTDKHIHRLVQQRKQTYTFGFATVLQQPRSILEGKSFLQEYSQFSVIPMSFNVSLPHFVLHYLLEWNIASKSFKQVEVVVHIQNNNNNNNREIVDRLLQSGFEKLDNSSMLIYTSPIPSLYDALHQVKHVFGKQQLLELEIDKRLEVASLPIPFDTSIRDRIKSYFQS